MLFFGESAHPFLPLLLVLILFESPGSDGFTRHIPQVQSSKAPPLNTPLAAATLEPLAVRGATSARLQRHKRTAAHGDDSWFDLIGASTQSGPRMPSYPHVPRPEQPPVKTRKPTNKAKAARSTNLKPKPVKRAVSSKATAGLSKTRERKDAAAVSTRPTPIAMGTQIRDKNATAATKARRATGGVGVMTAPLVVASGGLGGGGKGFTDEVHAREIPYALKIQEARRLTELRQRLAAAPGGLVAQHRSRAHSPRKQSPRVRLLSGGIRRPGVGRPASTATRSSPGDSGLVARHARRWSR